MITGISLGAALAALASYEIASALKAKSITVPISVYTFGEPRLGNKDLVEEINSVIPIYRVVLDKDPVPHLPPRQSPPHLNVS